MGTLVLSNNFLQWYAKLQLLQRDFGAARPVSRRLSLLAKIGLGLALLFITVQSLVPSSESLAPALSDKLLHLVAYAGVAGLAGAAWPELSLKKIFIGAVVWGLMIEILQMVMPFGREGSVLDIVANTIGAGMMCGAWALVAALFLNSKNGSNISGF